MKWKYSKSDKLWSGEDGYKIEKKYGSYFLYHYGRLIGGVNKVRSAKSIADLLTNG